MMSKARILLGLAFIGAATAWFFRSPSSPEEGTGSPTPSSSTPPGQEASVPVEQPRAPARPLQPLSAAPVVSPLPGTPPAPEFSPAHEARHDDRENTPPSAASELMGRVLATPLENRPPVVRRELLDLPPEAFELRMTLLRSLVGDDDSSRRSAGALAREELERRSIRELQVPAEIKRSYYTRLLELVGQGLGEQVALDLVRSETNPEQRLLLKEAFRSSRGSTPHESQ